MPLISSDPKCDFPERCYHLSEHEERNSTIPPTCEMPYFFLQNRIHSFSCPTVNRIGWLFDHTLLVATRTLLYFEPKPSAERFSAQNFTKYCCEEQLFFQFNTSNNCTAAVWPSELLLVDGGSCVFHLASNLFPSTQLLIGHDESH